VQFLLLGGIVPSMPAMFTGHVVRAVKTSSGGIVPSVPAMFTGYVVRAVKTSRLTTFVLVQIQTLWAADGFSRPRHQPRHSKCSREDESETKCHHVMPPLQAFSD
jgi:hypothetical protein